jgi:hypothetical protein
MNKITFKSRKEASEFLLTKGIDTSNWSEVKWLKLNKGQADIHMMATAEAIWDAMNESKPKLLQPGEWHIPYIDNIKNMEFAKFFGAANPKAKSFESSELYKTIIKISTGMAARTSYTTVGDEKEIKYETLIGIHDKMIEANPFHASPFEHCAPAMTDEEYASYIKGHVKTVKGETYGFILYDTEEFQKGWCRNFRGFIQYRELIENGKL